MDNIININAVTTGVTRTCEVCNKPTARLDNHLCEECINDIKWIKAFKLVTDYCIGVR